MNTVRILLLLAVVLCCGQSKLYAASATGNPLADAYIPDRWESNNNARKLYDTPIGSVFKFTPNPYFDFSSAYANNIGTLALCSVQTNLFDRNRPMSKLANYLVIDFKIRLFPAEDQQKLPNLCFIMTRSDNDRKNISRASDLNGIAPFDNSVATWPPFTSPWYSQYHSNSSHTSGAQTFNGEWYVPYYELIPFRIIYDTRAGSWTSVNINGVFSQSFGHYENIPAQQLFRTIGFYIPSSECLSHGTMVSNVKPKDLISLNKKIFRSTLEITLPEVRQIATENELKQLPPLQPMEYPYKDYPDRFGDIDKTNPDALYALAMKYIFSGRNPSQAVAWLQQAAQKRHLPAIYQLAVCYTRGIGVEPDRKLALNYLNQASEYSYPDAVALLGLLQIHRPNPNPFITVSGKKTLCKLLNLLPNWAGKHDNWMLALMFSNPHSLPLRNDYSENLKLEAWTVFHKLGYLYYYNTITPRTPSRQADAKNTLRPPSPSPVVGNSFTKINGRVVVAGNSMPIDFNTYNDRRSNQTSQTLFFRNTFKNAFLDRLIELEYPYAMLYKGRLILALPAFNSDPKRGIDFQLNKPPLSIKNNVSTMDQALAQAMPLFEAGARLGDPQCELELLFCQAQLGKLQNSDFSAEREARLTDYPLYHILRYAVAHPDTPGIREFLDRNYIAARKIWTDQPSPENQFLLGAEALYQFFDYGFDTAYYRIYFGDVKDVVNAYRNLDNAAQHGIAPAQYLCGVQFISGQRNQDSSQDNPSSSQIMSGRKLLTTAAAAGYLKANYYLVKHDFAKLPITAGGQWYEQLRPLRDAGSKEAWLLSGEILAQQPSAAPEKMQRLHEHFEKAAQLGSIRAWYRLGQLYATKYPERAESYWKEFINRDQLARLLDSQDLYFYPIAPLKTPAEAQRPLQQKL